jgi:hypothetical protein
MFDLQTPHFHAQVQELRSPYRDIHKDRIDEVRKITQACLDTCTADIIWWFFNHFLAFYGISARVDRKGGRMGGLETEIAPKDWTSRQ